MPQTVAMPRAKANITARRRFTRMSAFLPFRGLGRRDQERLARIEDPGVEEGGFLRLPPERAHGAREARPVQDLLLAAILDRRRRQAAPRLPVAASEGIEHAPVGGRVGPQVV